MALHAIKANKMRSFLTMLGIIIGIGSVIAIVSIGDTMRSMVADLYANVGMTRAIIYIWPSDGGDMRDSDYFNLEQMERIKEVFMTILSIWIPTPTTAVKRCLAGKK